MAESKSNKYIALTNAAGPKRPGIVNFKEGATLVVAAQQRHDPKTGMTTHITREKADELEKAGAIESFEVFEARREREKDEQEALVGA